jgi:crotonobetainyl-CoA:carnitine CoA-transferase CaiB-like acyl-CoA transferase
VLVENFAPGAIGRLGLGWDVVSERNPRLVMCSISAFGQEGPLAHLPGYDPIAQAYTGTMHMVGERTGAPAMMAFSPGDVLTGVHGLAGVCAALYHRERTGKGQKVEVSLVDSYATCHEINYQVTSASGGEFHPQRNGSVHPLIGGCGAFPVRDGYVALAVLNDGQWAGFCAAMGPDAPGDDPRFATTEGRTANAEAFNRLISDWLMTQPGRDAVVASLSAQRVPVAPVLSVEEAMANPHLRQNRTIRTVHDERLGPVDIPGMPIRFSAFPAELDLAAAALGAHNEHVVRGVLGKDAEAYDRLVATGVLRHEPQS